MFGQLFKAEKFFIICEEIVEAREATVKQVKDAFKQGLSSEEARRMIVTARSHYAAQAANWRRSSEIPLN